MKTNRVNQFRALSNFLNAPPLHRHDLVMLMFGPSILANVLGGRVRDNEVLLKCHSPGTTPSAVFAVPNHWTKADGAKTSFLLDLSKCGIDDSLTRFHSTPGSSPARAIHP